jgi:hypothetical protein
MQADLARKGGSQGVRFASHSDQIPQRNEMTRWAKNGHSR